MRMRLEGEHKDWRMGIYMGGPSQSYFAKLQTEAEVYSRVQARAEFERFLEASGLPEELETDLPPYSQADHEKGLI